MRTMSDRPAAKSLIIGKLAALAGVSADTVRFYERAGLLKKATRTSSGYRLYDESDVDRVKFIRRAKELGFTLEEVGQLLELSDGGTSKKVRAVAEKRLAEVERKMREMGRVREALKGLVQTCHGDVREKDCTILRALVPE